jgi:ABC-type glycerol-3-phosphate transport system substrate-binding protein
MKKLIALLMVLAMAFSLVACSETAAPAAEAPAAADAGPVDLAAQPAGSINLTVLMPLGQWTDNFNVLIDAYKAEHPEIGSIEASFPSSDVFEELLQAGLASGDFPDIFGTAYGTGMDVWWQYMADLSTGCPAYDLLTDDQKTLGTCGDYGMVIMPIYVEGTGIMYNMRLLKEAGWDHKPATRDELLQLVKDLVAKGIKPFMHHLSETYLNLMNWVGPTWMAAKENQGLDFLTAMLNGEDMHLEDDEDWNAFLDTYEQILIPYAQEGAIATDKWTCRNAFFLEECAMLVGEGSWETPNIANTNPALLDYVSQGLLPIYNDADKNMMQLQTISASVYNSGDPVRMAAAKDFLSFIVSSEAARVWHQELMGSPTSIVTLELSDNLPKLAADVVETMKAGKGAESMFEWTPIKLYPDLEEAWARFVAGSFTREEFTARYQKIFKDYSEGFYG